MVVRNPNRIYYFEEEYEGEGTHPLQFDDHYPESHPTCGSESPNITWSCTRPEGHKGPHEGIREDDSCGVWRNENESST